MGAEAREKKMGNGRDKNRGKKKVSMRRDEPGINNLVSLVGLRRGERVSGA